MIQIVKATIKEGVTPEIGNSGTTTDIPSIFPSFNQNHCTATVAVATDNAVATPREDSISSTKIVPNRSSKKLARDLNIRYHKKCIERY